MALKSDVARNTTGSQQQSQKQQGSCTKPFSIANCTSGSIICTDIELSSASVDITNSVTERITCSTESTNNGDNMAMSTKSDVYLNSNAESNNTKGSNPSGSSMENKHKASSNTSLQSLSLPQPTPPPSSSSSSAFALADDTGEFIDINDTTLPTDVQDNNNGMLNENGMIPRCFTPIIYNIHLSPDIDKGTFSGSVCITAKINKPTQNIVLHAQELSIYKVSVYNVESGSIIATVSDDEVKYSSSEEAIAIPLPMILYPPPSALDGDNTDSKPASIETEYNDSILIIMSFSGTLGDNMFGLYRSRYRDASGESSFMLATQFQAKYARLAFPCWDEPSIKAAFELSLTVPASFTALSNMPMMNTIDHGSTKTVYFERTPIMSTYLLAITAGELKYVEGISYSGAIDNDTSSTNSKRRKPVICRVYTPPADVEKVKFSLDTAVRVLEILADMFSYEYPLPKLDLVAVPEFEAGAMENWGLVMFRTVRLYITDQTSLWIRQKAVYVISHELSHQWFGNLVTMRWWDDLWLNEGFATWIGILITDKMYPKWQRWDYFAIEDRQSALVSDALRSSHPIKVDIKGNADIDQVFDPITYYKGCSLIRMLSEYLTIETFMDGVCAYLVKHQYSTATTADLWEALQEASGRDVSAFMHNWTAKVGYPVITVEDIDDKGKILVKQSRYLYSGNVLPEDDTVLWQVPLGIYSSEIDKPQPSNGMILNARSAIIEIPGGREARWFKLNYGNSGLYRVCYSEKALSQIAKAIKRKEISTVDAVGVLIDTIALVTSGYIRTSRILDMLDAFKSVNKYVVWQIISIFMESLYVTWVDDEDQTLKLRILKLTRGLFGSLAASLGWKHNEDDSTLKARLRAISIPRAGWAGDPVIIEEGCRLFKEFYENPGGERAFHPDFTSSVFEMAVRNGPPENYYRARDMYENSERWNLSEDHRMAALGAMSCSVDRDKMLESLEYAMGDKVLPQDLNIVIGFMITGNNSSKHLVWNWFTNNYSRICGRLGECSTLLGYVIRSVISEFATMEMANVIEEWFKDKKTATFDRMLPQVLESIRIRAAWFNRDRDNVIAWFSENVTLN